MRTFTKHRPTLRLELCTHTFLYFHFYLQSLFISRKLNLKTYLPPKRKKTNIMPNSRRSSTSSSDGDDRIVPPHRYGRYILPRRYNEYNNRNTDRFASSDEDELARRIGRRTQRRLALEARREEARTWVPPRPEYEYEQAENVDRLRYFQQMPPEQKRRVLHLNIRESYTTAQAIDTVMTEAKHNLLEAPLAECKELTATIRLLYKEEAEKMFGQWNVLEHFIRTVPQDQVEAAERVFRLVCLDPYDRQFMMWAEQLARARMNSDFLDKLLHEMVKTAFRFKAHYADLQALRRYDSPPADPPKLAMTDDMIEGVSEILKLERLIEQEIPKVANSLHGYKTHMRKWLRKILELNPSDPTAQMVTDRYPHLWNRGYYNVAECFSEIIDELGEEELECYDADEPFTIMCIGFYHCCIGISGRVSYSQLERVIARHEWPETTTAELARAVRDGTSHVYGRESSKYEFEVGKYLVEDLKDEYDLNPAVVDFLYEFEADSGAAASMALECDWSFLPADVQARMFSFGMAEMASEALGMALLCSLSALSALLDDANFRVQNALYEISGPAAAMGMHRKKWMAIRAMAYGRVVGQMDELADMIKASYYEKPRKKMHKQLLNASGVRDIQRLRDLAFAGNAEPPIKEGIEVVLQGAAVLEQLGSFIADTEHAHLARLTRFDEAALISGLTSFLDQTSWHAIRATLTQLTDADTANSAFTRWDISGPLRPILASRPPSSTLDDAIKALCTAALHDPTTNLLRLLQAAPPPPPSADALSSNELNTLARLVLRAWYLSQEDAPATAPDQLRWLSRHCWLFGMLCGWQMVPTPQNLWTVTEALLEAPDVADVMVLPDDMFGLAPPKGELDVPVVVGYADMHRLVRVEGSVVDGGRIVVLEDDEMETA